MVEKVIRDGKVAVLVSPGYGSGWSSWAHEGKEEIACFHPKFVAWVEGGKKESIKEIAKQVFGEEHFCILGADNLEIEWVPVGTRFRIDEYDGAESLETLDGISFFVA